MMSKTLIIKNINGKLNTNSLTVTDKIIATIKYCEKTNNIKKLVPLLKKIKGNTYSYIVYKNVKISLLENVDNISKLDLFSIGGIKTLCDLNIMKNEKVSNPYYKNTPSNSMLRTKDNSETLIEVGTYTPLFFTVKDSNLVDSLPRIWRGNINQNHY